MSKKTPVKGDGRTLSKTRTTRSSRATNEGADRPVMLALVYIVLCGGVRVGRQPWRGYENHGQCVTTCNA